MASFLLFFVAFLTQKPAPCCCWQLSPGSVSPLVRAARFSAARKQALLFIVWVGREEEAEGKVLWGHGEREREKGRGNERERWSQYSGMCLGKPRVDTAQMTVRESLAEGSRGTPLNTSSPLPPSPASSPSLSFSLPTPFPLSSALSLFVSSAEVPASLSAIKTLYNQGGSVMGKQAYVRLVEHGKQQNPLLHISAAADRVQPRVPPCAQPCPTWTLKNPPDSKFE